MSSGKKGESQQNPGQNGGAASGAREKVQAAGQQVQQGAEQAANRLRDGYDSAREQALHGYRRAEGTVARNPTSSVLVGFGIGFGLGLVLTTLFARPEETWAEKYLPESLQDVPDRYKKLVSSLKGVPGSVKQALPDVSDRYQSLVEALKDVPDSVRSNLPRSIAKHLG